MHLVNRLFHRHALDPEADILFHSQCKRTFGSGWIEQSIIVFVVGAHRVNDVPFIGPFVAKRLAVKRVGRNDARQIAQGRWQLSLVLKTIKLDANGDVGAKP